MVESSTKIDWDFFELQIAYHCTFNDTYLATISDHLELRFIGNSDVKSYLNIILDFYQKNTALPSATEIKTYLSDDNLKTSYKNVVIQFKTIDSEYNEDELLANTEQY